MTNMAEELIAVVDTNDNVTEYKDKLEVHEQGLLHRAFSVFVFNSDGEMLLQKRAATKYHSPGLWTNACCSHLLPGKSMEQCAHERLSYEMGFDCELTELFTFHYKATFSNGLTENEIDHVYIGKYSGVVDHNSAEVDDYNWIKLHDILENMDDHPEKYTYWFRYILENYSGKLKI